MSFFARYDIICYNNIYIMNQIDQRDPQDEIQDFNDILDEKIRTIDDLTENERAAWTKKEKFLVSIFLFVGAVTLLLGFLQFYDRKAITIDDVFGPPSNTASAQNSASVSYGSAQTGSEDRSLDTDGDGLTDYDEVNRYNTSAYLEDSDSDGINDKAEIELGQDPNCPKGKICGFTSTVDTDPIENGFTAGIGSVEDTVPELNSFENNLIRGAVSPEELRAYLSESGVSSIMLDQIDDDTLMDMYRKTLEESTGSAQGVNESTQFENLSPDQVRDLMIQGGMDADSVYSLSDEEVTQVYLEALNELVQ